MSERYDAKRWKLVCCARELAEHDDAAHISITKVAERAGVTRGLLYYYFSDKNDLLRAVADTYVDELLDSMSHALAVAGDRDARIARVVACAVRWLYQDEGTPRRMWHVLAKTQLVDYAWSQAIEGMGALIVAYGLPVDEGTDVATLVEHARFVAQGILGEARLNHGLSQQSLANSACASLDRTKEPA